MINCSVEVVPSPAGHELCPFQIKPKLMTFPRPALLLLLLPFLTNVHAQSIDQSASSISFKIGNMKISSVNGSFSGLKGNAAFDPSDPARSKFAVCVDAATVDTGNKKRDKHLRTDDFFDVEKYPAICFASTSVEKAENGFMAKGKLTMHGITKDVEVTFTYGNRTLTGTITVNRLDYGVGPSGTFMAGDEVEISIVCVMK